jgi:uncharacterized membrane protein YjfL (UPF0719 family)
MNEILDKLLIRFLFTIFICVALILYKYGHTIFYPSQKKQVLKKIYPTENAVDTIHLFSRLIGVSIIFSTLEFNEYIGIFISSFHFFIWSIIGFIIYLLSIWLMESIVFYDFEYKDEVLKKKNMAYGIVSFSMAISLAYIIRTVLKESEASFILLLIFWLFAMVLFGFASKLYKYTSKLSFHSLMIQSNVGLGLSYGGFILGNTIVLTSAFSHEHHDIVSYCVQVILKTLVGALIIPIFRLGIMYIFRIKENEQPHAHLHSHAEEKTDLLGRGIYEGAVFITSAFLASIIIGQIHFGTIYPFF